MEATVWLEAWCGIATAHRCGLKDHADGMRVSRFQWVRALLGPIGRTNNRVAEGKPRPFQKRPKLNSRGTDKVKFA